MSRTLALWCAAIVAASLLGGAWPLWRALTHKRLQVYLSFAAGAMLGAAFLHMLPEAVDAAKSPGVIRWAAAGLLSLFFLERFFAFHHHEAPAVAGEPCPPGPHDHADGHGHAAGLVAEEAPGGGRSRSTTKGASLNWGAAAVGLAVHSLAGGVALASAEAAGPWASALGVFLATVVHKPADALTIVGLMLRAGVPRRSAHLVNLGFSAMIPAGVLLFRIGLRWAGPDLASAITADALAFSAGTFLCIALSDILPELQFHAHDRLALSASLLAGFGVMAATSALG